MKTIITEIPDYRTFLRGEKSLEIGYPWLTFGAILALEKILKDSRGKFNVLECGSGGSTLFFEKRCKQVLSLEHNTVWTEMVKDKLKRGNVELVCFSNRRLRKIIRKQKDGCFDLILIDNGSGAKTYVHRQSMLDDCQSKLKIGGWLVIDNYSRLNFDYSNYKVYTFDMFRYSGTGTKICKRLT